MTVTLRAADSPELFDIARALLREYAIYLNHSLGEEHICLADYENELASLPGRYSAPHGVILLAFVDEQPAGCVALKPLKPFRAVSGDETACEMKRLWVRPEFRGQSIGRALVGCLIERARSAGYSSIYLDTVPAAMKFANDIYLRLGFQRVDRYNTNPILGTTPAAAVEFFRLKL